MLKDKESQQGQLALLKSRSYNIYDKLKDNSKEYINYFIKKIYDI